LKHSPQHRSKAQDPQAIAVQKRFVTFAWSAAAKPTLQNCGQKTASAHNLDIFDVGLQSNSLNVDN
jgi:hypothetical protein